MKKVSSLILSVLMIVNILLPSTFASAQTTQTSIDGRISIKDGNLLIPSGSEVIYHTKASFEGNYTIEIREAVLNQAVGLMFGSGTTHTAMWSLALVSPIGLWQHMPENWNSSGITKTQNDNVRTGQFVTLKLDINDGIVTTFINNVKINDINVGSQFTSGPIGLRFSQNESASIDYLKVTKDNSTVWEDDFEMIDTSKWDFPAPRPDTTPGLSEIMKPVWQGDTVYKESAWPISEADGSVKDIGLLYTADEIISVTNAQETITYTAGVDYNLIGGKLSIPNGSAIGVMSYAAYHPSTGSFPSAKGGYIFFPGENAQIINSQIKVTYKHSDEWSGNPIQSKSYLLPKTHEKLRAGGNFNIVYYGDSITEGYNSSSFIKTEPYMPRWSELVTETLQKAYPDSNIIGTNTGLSGTNTDWGVKNISNRVIQNNPDLVVLAFGMNDGSEKRSSASYINNIKSTMTAVKKVNPNCEFVLVTTTLPNPDATGFAGLHKAYEQEVLKLQAESVAVADMTAVHESLLQRKAYRDMTGNNVNHPNDFLVRCYAQTIFETIYGYDFETQYNDLSYVDGSTNIRQTMNIMLPSNGRGKFPVVMYIHGGAWVQGDKSDLSEAQGAINKLLENGYAVAAINYRYAQQAKWPAQIYDCKAAVRFLRANADKYHMNAEQITAFGCSAGAHLAQFMGATNGVRRFENLSMGNADYKSDVQAVVSWYGISDISNWKMADWLSTITTTGKDPVTTLLGDNYTKEQALDASPITHASKDTTPILLTHGRNDDTVAFSQSETYAKKLKTLIWDENVETYFVNVGQHADSKFWNSTESVNRVLNFLQKQFYPTKHLSSDENTRPSYWTVNLAGYQNKYIGLKYANNSNTQKLHLVLPNTQGEHPLVIFIHGGGFGGGNSNGSQVLYTAEGPLQALKRGYAVAMVDYRYNPEGHFPQPIYDIKAAVRYLRANASTYNLNPYRFAIWGESAGGLLADFTALTNGNSKYEDLSMGNADVSSEVHAAVSWYAITDMTTARNAQYCNALLGASQTANITRTKEASPINQVTQNAVPFYLQHGLGDTEVEAADSINLYNKILKTPAGAKSVIELFPGIEHAVKKYISANNVTKIVDWLDKTLIGEKPKPPVVNVSGIKLNATQKTMYINGLFTAKAYVNPTNATNNSVKWSTSSKSVATVSQNGVIKAVGTGIAVISATTVDGSKTSKITVTVRPKAPTSFKFKKSGKKVTLSYKKAAGVTKYVIYKKTGAKGKWVKLKETSALKVIVSLKKKKTYYFRALSYKKQGKVKIYSPYTKTIHTSIK